MKTILIRKAGGPEVLELSEGPAPQPQAGEILVTAAAIGVGWPDVLIRNGVYKWMPKLPKSPGSELAGTISAVGSGVSGFKIGQKILVSARDFSERGGCYTEVIALPASLAHALPDHTDLIEAVCLPNYQVAKAVLESVKPGAKSAFISGAAGAIGGALVQLCKAEGMSVIGTVSSDGKALFAKTQGADHTINYKHQNIIDRVREITGGRGVDLVLDHVGGPDFADNFKLLGPFGTLVSYNSFTAPPKEDFLAAMRSHHAISPGLRLFSMHTYDNDHETRRRIMTDVIALFAKGAIKPVVGAKLKLDQAAEAHRLLETGTVLGKIVLTP